MWNCTVYDYTRSLYSQLAFDCSKLTTETLEQDAEYVQSLQ